MEYVALIVAVLALLLALVAFARSGASSRGAEDVRADVRRQLSNQADELATALGALRELLARQAAGETLDAEQIREGRLWRDMAEADAVLDAQSHKCRDVALGVRAVTELEIHEELFPKNFFDHPIHLHHDHETGMTIGAVHAQCNAVLWQYHGE